MRYVTYASEWWQVGSFWVAVTAVIVALSIGVMSGWIASRNIQKRRILYGVDDCSPLIAEAGRHAKITVLHGTEPIDDPHLVKILVASRSRQDIDDSNFRNAS